MPELQLECVAEVLCACCGGRAGQFTETCCSVWVLKDKIHVSHSLYTLYLAPALSQRVSLSHTHTHTCTQTLYTCLIVPAYHGRQLQGEYAPVCTVVSERFGFQPGVCVCGTNVNDFGCVLVPGSVWIQFCIFWLRMVFGMELCLKARRM